MWLFSACLTNPLFVFLNVPELFLMEHYPMKMHVIFSWMCFFVTATISNFFQVVLGEAQNFGANMSALSSKLLAELLHNPDLMQKVKIIDCSPAVSHNTSHIHTSNHFLCTAITLRRYSSTTLLKHILTEGKLNSFLSNELTHVVLYNANGSRCLAIKKALHALQSAKESLGLSTQISILSGEFGSRF